jgi:hypothetical protein
MTVIKSPGAVEAAHGASETDELGRRVGSENSLLAELTQGPVCAAPAPHGGGSGVRANLVGAAEIAKAAKHHTKQSPAEVLQIIIEPTRSRRKWVARLGDRVLCVAAAPFVKSARMLLAEGYSVDTLIEMWRPNATEWALRGRLGAVAATVMDGERAPRRAKNGSPVRDQRRGSGGSPSFGPRDACRECWVPKGGRTMKPAERVNLSSDDEQSRCFLDPLDPNASNFTFQTFDDDRTRKNPALTHIVQAPLSVRDELVKLNKQGAGVFVTSIKPTGAAVKARTSLASEQFGRKTMTALTDRSRSCRR